MSSPISPDLAIVIIAAFINFVLSLSVPVLLQNDNTSFLIGVKHIYKTNKTFILTSTILVLLFTYAAVSSKSWFQDNVFAQLAKLK
jgi:hypothetical protein